MNDKKLNKKLRSNKSVDTKEERFVIITIDGKLFVSIEVTLDPCYREN